MAILSGHKKEKEYIADQNGDHTLVSKWTHADSVEMPNGQTLSEFTFDDSKVSQIQSDSGVSGKYNILLSETANSGTTLTERARKTSQLYWYSNAKLLAVYTDNKGVGIKNDDILMSGTDNTWDGTNTSLKAAIAAAGQGGGGGTTVIANPSGAATDDLISIQIGSTIYDIPSGGGSGSGGGRTETVLFSGFHNDDTDITLTNDITQYDEVIVETCYHEEYQGDFYTHFGSAILPKNSIMNAYTTYNPSYSYSGLIDFSTAFYSSDYAMYWNIKIPTTTTIKIDNKYTGDWNYSQCAIIKITGVKYNGGGATPVELTKAQYDALTSEQKNDPTKIYFVTDYEPIPNNGDRINTQAAVNMGRNTHIAKLSNTGTDIVHT